MSLPWRAVVITFSIMPVCLHTMRDRSITGKTMYLSILLMSQKTPKGHPYHVLLLICGPQASEGRHKTVRAPPLDSNREGRACLIFITFIILIHWKSGCLFGDNWKKKFCGRMLWFWLNQVFGQISPRQWKHSLPQVVTFVGGKELALKQIMEQMFYAKSESGDA